jgi:hypothetical protein
MEKIGTGGLVSKVPGGVKTLVLTGLVTLGGAGAAVVATRDGGGGDGSALRATCPAPATGAVASTQVACATVLPPKNKNSRTQIIDLASPEQVPLKFSFCNGLTCGDANPECYSNKWIPSFAGQVPASITVPVPDGLTIGKVTVGSAGDSGSAGYAKGADVSMSTSPDGQAHIQLNVVSHELAHAVQATNGQVCGIPEEEKNQLEQAEGTVLNGQKTRSVRVVIEWEGPLSTPLPATVRVNEGNPVTLPGSP